MDEWLRNECELVVLWMKMLIGMCMIGFVLSMCLYYVCAYVFGLKEDVIELASTEQMRVSEKNGKK